jgi:hypothetical protein
MTTASKTVGLITLTLIIFALAGNTALANHFGTIITKTGDEYKSVSFYVNTNYRIVTVYSEIEKNISFTNIEAIYDTDGNDITADVLGGYYKPEKETWRSEDDPRTRKYREKPFNMGFRAGLNYSIPISDYYFGIDPGIGFGGDLIIAVTNEIDVRMIISKSGMKVSDQFRAPFYSTDPDVVILHQDISLVALRYVFTVQYHKPLMRQLPGQITLYTYTGLGAISHRFHVELLAQDNLTYETYVMDESSTETKLLFNIGFGGIIMMSPSIGVDVCGDFNMVFAGTYGGSLQYGYILDFRLGLVALF